jgi:hypothetical protein
VPGRWPNRAAWLHALPWQRALLARARAGTLAWRIYAYWHQTHRNPAKTTPEQCRAEVARIPRLALAGRHAPTRCRRFSDWAEKKLTSEQDMARRRHSPHWRAGYQLLYCPRPGPGPGPGRAAVASDAETNARARAVLDRPGRAALGRVAGRDARRVRKGDPAVSTRPRRQRDQCLPCTPADRRTRGWAGPVTAARDMDLSVKANGLAPRSPISVTARPADPAVRPGKPPGNSGGQACGIPGSAGKMAALQPVRRRGPGPAPPRNSLVRPYRIAVMPCHLGQLRTAAMTYIDDGGRPEILADPTLKRSPAMLANAARSGSAGRGTAGPAGFGGGSGSGTLSLPPRRPGRGRRRPAPRLPRARRPAVPGCAAREQGPAGRPQSDRPGRDVGSLDTGQRA